MEYPFEPFRTISSGALALALCASTAACKEALAPLAVAAADVAVAVAAEGIRSALSARGERAADANEPDPSGAPRLVLHPLANRIATHDDGVIGPRTFAAALQRADVVWLSLRYDNADQIRVASRLLESIGALGTQPVVLIAAMPATEQSQLPRFDALLGADTGARRLAESLPWSSYGVETPAMLEPLLAVALQRRLPLRAAGYSDAGVRLFAADADAVDSQEGRALGLDAAWSAARRESLQNALTWQRCATLPEAIRDSLLLVDRAKSAGLARNVLAAVPGVGTGPRAIVLTDLHRGRLDVGAPAALAAQAARAGRKVSQYAVGMIEVDAERTEIEQYDVESSRHSALWLTPALHDLPCADAQAGAPAR